MSPRSQSLALLAGLVLMTALAGALRTARLAERPMHADEAVHALKLADLREHGRYIYDPREFHGPTLYYFTIPLLIARGEHNLAELDERTLRLVPALFGTLLVPLIWLARRELGAAAALFAALLAACSPLLVYYSRDYIQESLLAFFSFATLLSAWKFTQRPTLLLAALTGACAGLAFATKETALIVLACLVCAMGLVRPGRFRATAAGEAAPVAAPRLSGRRATVSRLLVLSVACLVTAALLHSNFLRNPRGARDGWAACAIYFDRARGAEAAHLQPLDYYLSMLTICRSAGGPVWSEAPILLLAVAGAAALLLKARTGGDPRFGSLVAAFCGLLFAAYSMIPYKTPWCAVGFWHMATLLGGLGAAAFIRAIPGRWKAPAAALLSVLILIQLAPLAWRSATTFSADVRNPYAYAPTLRSATDLATWLERLQAVDAPSAPIVKVVADNPWPLPWMLRRIRHAGYWETPPEDCDADVIITTTDLAAAVAARQRDSYCQFTYGLRPAETLIVFVSNELYERFRAAASTAPAN